MKTIIFSSKEIEKAAKIIESGGLVAFPTETVYGLGANALDEKAVKKIFEAKGRPSDNPLIVHIAEESDIEKYAKNIPSLAYTLANAFWPGPLTLVLEKQAIIPDITTAGLPTVCLRIPADKIALELIRRSGVPLAAPSANTSTRPSPTSHHHVLSDMDGRIDAIIEGDMSNIGIESTVLDLTVSPPVILRPGGVTEEMLREYTELGENIGTKTVKSPGNKYRHYAPNLDIIIVEKFEISDILERIKGGEKIGLMGLYDILGTNNIRHPGGMIAQDLDFGGTKNHSSIFLFPSIEDFSRQLFDTFRRAETLSLTSLYIENIDEIGLGRGIMNRVRKAASGK